MSTSAPDAQIEAFVAAVESDPHATLPVPLRPPRSWFEEVPDWFVPPAEGGPPVQIDMNDEVGRVAALVAPYGECILNGRAGCWTPGQSQTGYEYAHVGSVVTAEGETVRTANVGGGIDHFPVEMATAASLAADHYANTATRRMVGRYIDHPPHGIMFLGSLYPGTTAMHAFEAMTSALSGDWRWIESMQDHEMVGSQLVNNPAFRAVPPRRAMMMRRSFVAAVSFEAPQAVVASLGEDGCTGPVAILSRWEPVVIEPPERPGLGERIVARIASLESGVAMLVEDFHDDAELVDIDDIDGDGDEGEDWADEFADLQGDECKHCRGMGCARCGWMGYHGPDDEAETIRVAMVAAAKARDGDGDGFVYDGTPRQRPYNPATDLKGRAPRKSGTGKGRKRKSGAPKSGGNGGPGPQETKQSKTPPKTPSTAPRRADRPTLTPKPDGPPRVLEADEYGIGEVSPDDYEWDAFTGRWSRKNPVGRPDPEEVDRYLKDVEARIAKVAGTDDPEQRAKDLDDILGEGSGSLLDTEVLHDRRGASGDGWTLERQALHHEMIEDILDQVEAAGVPKDREMIFLGGLPGAGKSSSLRPGGPAADMGVVAWEPGSPVPEGANFVSVNPDLFKEAIAERGLATTPKGLKPMETAAYMHEESSTLAKLLEQELLARGYNIAHDGTMGGEGSVRKKVARGEAAGFKKPRALFVDITPGESLASAKARYQRAAASEQGGRLVPSGVTGNSASTKGNYSANRDYFDNMVADGLFDEAIVVDNTGVSLGQPRSQVVGRVSGGRWVEGGPTPGAPAVASAPPAG